VSENVPDWAKQVEVIARRFFEDMDEDDWQQVLAIARSEEGL
jgi:hypothetical protein